MHTSVNIINKQFSDLNPLSFGFENCDKGHHFGPHVRNDFIIHYVVKGKGKFLSEKGEFPVEKGMIFIIRPNEITFYQADMIDPWEYIWVSFNGSLAGKLFDLENPVISITSRVFIEMKECVLWEDVKEEFLVSKLHLLFTELFRGTKDKDDYIKQVTDYISSRYMFDISVEDIAATIKLNRSYLSKLFRNRMGITLQQYIIDVRMQNAKKLLKQGLSINNTAFSVGYTDVFNFSKMFKRKTGVSPREYSKKLRVESS